ncbi:MAG: DUF3445 domain-containing protein [Ilumatobacteraceae bacterium]|nr:DUF3445 domain-containing protein [Ilumatobacteraceae bacterium]
MTIPNHLLPDENDARLRVGARALPASQWVSEVDEQWQHNIDLKKSLLAKQHDDVVGCVAGNDDACEEAARGIADSLALKTEENWRGIDALEQVVARVADDVCILTINAESVLVLSAAVLCAPNRWKLADKLGKPMDAVHAPVARYDTDLARPVDAFLNRLAVDRPMWRTNWGIVNDPMFFQPVIVAATPNMDVGDLLMRVEYQTLRRLSVSGAVMFTIRTFQEQLSDLVARVPRMSAVLTQLIESLPDNVAEYKSIAPYRESLLRWCSQH